MELDGLVVKIASRCNINCKYCYMYNLGDQTFHSQPKFLSREYTLLLAKRVREYCIEVGKLSFDIIIHGGEPLLMPIKEFEYFLVELRRALPREIIINFSVQTNGVMIDSKWLKLFEKHSVSIGISLDGYQAINDLYRLDHKGNSTYQRTLSGLQRAMAFPGMKQQVGVLAVMTPFSDPLKQYSFFKSLGISSLDFLFPHYNYESPPPGINSCIYADWWIDLFEIWYYDKDYNKPSIRFLKQLVITILGCNVGFDMLGNMASKYLVVETDGSIETVDSLKSCEDGLTKEGIHINTHALFNVAGTKMIDLYYNSHMSLPDVCIGCPINEICGGGFLAHRYSKTKGFNNPTVYCRNMIKIISRIQNIVIGDLSAETQIEAGLKAINMHEVLDYLDEH